jgi:hypothetical protein
VDEKTTYPDSATNSQAIVIRVHCSSASAQPFLANDQRPMTNDQSGV